MEKNDTLKQQAYMEKGEAKHIPEKGDPVPSYRESQRINNDHLQNSFYNFTVNPKLESLSKYSEIE
ncbi:hypothetical protein SAMN02745248_02754 [Hathewaya proteolytica DSM 3090]|uniref:Uncharacterized protein n=1 Tax=Hathewaya proteolytica DSM 3090 TaxID=1121331 RepID=A0A1M6T8M6_9CLOT|nr:hypothetical protein [Hathewaya proteolytica]SHK53335.1 hypothetical protein SAMN02745248_02754 [Hathewaya proteolytica DSM 3090]